jgi:hypothetical protein
MKTQIHNYTFDPTTKIVTLTDFQSVSLERLLVVANTTTATTLFTFADSAAGLASVSTTIPNAFVLTADTAGMAATNALSIFYDVGPDDSPLLVEPLPVKVVNQPAVSDTPIVTSLIGPTGDPIDVENRGLLVTDTKSGDQVVGGSPQQVVKGQRQAGTYAEFRFTNPSGSTINGPTLDASAYRSVSVQSVVGVVTLQGSNDGVTWVSHALTNIASVGASIPAVTVPTATIAAGTLRTRYFRVQLPTTTTAIVTLFSGPMDNAGVPTLPVQGTPAIAGVANAAGALGAVEAQVNSPTVAGAIGSWFPQSDEADGRFTPTPSAINQTPARERTSSHTGTGVAAAGLVGHYNDSAPTVPTENTMGRVRVGRLRSVYSALRDGSANPSDRGAKVTGREALVVEDAQSGQFGDNPIVQAVPGIQVVSLAGPTGELIDAEYGGLRVTVDDYTDVSAVTSAVSSTTAQLLLPASRRKGAVISNDSTSVMYVKFGVDVSPTSYTYRIVSYGTLELPVPIYRGPISAVWVAANGAAYVTELF